MQIPDRALTGKRNMRPPAYFLWACLIPCRDSLDQHLGHGGQQERRSPCHSHLSAKAACFQTIPTEKNTCLPCVSHSVWGSLCYSNLTHILPDTALDTWYFLPLCAPWGRGTVQGRVPEAVKARFLLCNHPDSSLLQTVGGTLAHLSPIFLACGPRQTLLFQS